MATGNAPDAVTLLWQEQEEVTARRGPKPGLTLDAIARAGIGIADADGLAAVTMRHVADALGVTKMALYRYLPGKIELVALMVDLGIGAPPRLDAVPGGWRPRLWEWAQQLYTRFRRHPWALEATVGSRAIGPNELGWLEQAVAALAGTGLDGGQTLDVTATLAGHVRGIVAQTAATAGGTPELAMGSAMADLVRGREDRFPALLAALNSAAADGTQDDALDFGLARILDGVEQFVAGRARTRRS